MIRLAVLLLTVLTGFAGLVYEVAWQKYLAALLGSHGEATAAVLAIFLGGLSLGYALFGRASRWLVARSRQHSRPVRLFFFYAVVEAGIGLHALLFPTLFGVFQQISLFVPHGGAGLGFAFDVVLSALLIGPPTVLMGGTIPILTLALAGDLKHATRIHALVYGFNTIGAFFGALAGGFILIPLLGLDGVVYAMGCVNLVAAAIFAQLDRHADRIELDLKAPVAVEPVARFAAWATVSLLAGFAMMALQTTFNRVGALAFGASQFTFALIVAVFVACIALGSLAVSAIGNIPRGLVVGSQWLLVLLLFPLYLAMEDAPYWAHVIRVLFQPIDQAFHPFYLLNFEAVFLALFVPIGLSGALLPLLFHELRREVRELGVVAGRLYAWTTFGSLLGALLGGYLLLFWLDLHHIFRIAMAAIAIGSSILTVLVLRPTPGFSVPVRIVVPVVLIPTLGAIALLPPWSAEKLSSGLFRSRSEGSLSFLGPEKLFAKRDIGVVISYDDGPTSTVSVVDPDGSADNRSIMVNGKSDGALQSDYPTMSLTALIPALMAERHENVFVIGYGTGVTTGEIAVLDETKTVTVAEISHGVIRAAPLFDAGNLAASKNPKVSIRRGDAYRALLQSEEMYDVIVSEPSNPWVIGVEMLYSREFLKAARERLTPGGVYAQWFHSYETDSEVVALVLRTYTSVFPHVSVWYTQGADMLLLGFNEVDRALDVEALRERFRQDDFAAAFGRVGIESFAQLVAHELLPLGTLHAIEQPGDVHTLRHPILSYRAARAFFRGRMGTLAPHQNRAQERVAIENSLLRRYAKGRQPIPEALIEAAALESCRLMRNEHCGTFFALWSLYYPQSPALKGALKAKRKQGSPASKYLTQQGLAGLKLLFGGHELNEGKRYTAGEAERLTGRFRRHYFHVVPFRRDRLDEIWDRCHEADCEERRRKAENEIGIPHRDPGASAGGPTRKGPVQAAVSRAGNPIE
jgi:predicted membrane-bound spermidine synthase